MIFSYVRLFKAQDRMDHDSLCLEYSGPPRLPHLVFNQRENGLGENFLLDVPLCFPFDIRHVTLCFPQVLLTNPARKSGTLTDSAHARNVRVTTADRPAPRADRLPDNFCV
jgi:hypothetical protein